MAHFVLTVIGDDRPGLVAELSAPITAHGASWERSQMSHLGGKFAGILLLEVAADRADALTRELAALEGLEVLLERTGGDQRVEAPVTFTLDLLGDDRPGIVAEISAALAERGVSIEELETGVRDAPMAGGTLFEAHALLAAPADLPAEELNAALEALADELMVDLELSEGSEG